MEYDEFMARTLLLRTVTLLFVIASYFMVCERSPNFLAVTPYPKSHYQYLADGFLHQHLYLNREVPAGLFKLSNPYDSAANHVIRDPIFLVKNHRYEILYNGLHDVSFYKQKLFFYFGPLPILLVILPIKLIFNYYIYDVTALFIFLSFAFLAQFVLLINIRNQFFSKVSELQLTILGLAIGLTNNAPFLLIRPKFYELAIASAYFCISMSALYLYRITCLKPNILNMIGLSLFLGLAVAGRPDFAATCFIMCIGLIIWISFYSEYPKKISALMALFLPLCIIGISLAAYNYLRFHSIFEFGQRYQLAGSISQQQANVLIHFDHLWTHISHGIYYLLNGFHYYLHDTSAIYAFTLQDQYVVENFYGILSTTTYVICVLFLILFIKNKKMQIRHLLHFMFLYLLVPLSTIAFLCLLNGFAQRYITDFLPHLIILSIVSVWLLQYKIIHYKHYQLIEIFFLTVVLSNIIFCYGYMVTHKADIIQLLS